MNTIVRRPLTPLHIPGPSSCVPVGPGSSPLSPALAVCCRLGQSDGRAEGQHWDNFKVRPSPNVSRDDYEARLFTLHFPHGPAPPLPPPRLPVRTSYRPGRDNGPALLRAPAGSSSLHLHSGPRLSARNKSMFYFMVPPSIVLCHQYL